MTRGLLAGWSLMVGPNGAQKDFKREKKKKYLIIFERKSSVCRARVGDESRSRLFKKTTPVSFGSSGSALFLK